MKRRPSSASCLQKTHLVILTDESLLPGSQEEQQSKKKGGVYNRDDLELQIMIGQEVHLGTLACTAVEPLKVLSIATYHYSFASNITKSKKKSQNWNFFWKILRSKWHRAKVPPKRFHLTGNTMRFHPEIRKLQHAEKVVFDCPGLVYFAIGLVNSLLNLLDRQVKSL